MSRLLNKKVFLENGMGVICQERLIELPGFPGSSFLGEKPMAILECDQEIPCNPCEDICPNGAIKVGSPITNLPKIDPERCTGCTRCLRVCPGLCIFVVQKDFSEKTSLVYIPYEFLPLPDKGEKVYILDRFGRMICNGKISKVIKKDKESRTAIIAMEVPKEHHLSARHFKLYRGDDERK